MVRIKVLDTSIIDDMLWYTISCDREVKSWVDSLENSYDYYIIYGTTSVGTLIAMREDVYTFTMIKWG